MMLRCVQLVLSRCSRRERYRLMQMLRAGGGGVVRWLMGVGGGCGSVCIVGADGHRARHSVHVASHSTHLTRARSCAVKSIVPPPLPPQLFHVNTKNAAMHSFIGHLNEQGAC